MKGITLIPVGELSDSTKEKLNNLITIRNKKLETMKALTIKFRKKKKR